MSNFPNITSGLINCLNMNTIISYPGTGHASKTQKISCRRRGGRTGSGKMSE